MSRLVDRLVPALSLVTLVVLAACVGPGASVGQPDPTPDGPPSTNPWGDDPIVVAVDGDASQVERVREATAFWAGDDRQFLDYDVQYAVRPDASAPDLTVVFVDEVPTCDGVADPAGCAPLVRTPAAATPSQVYVRDDLDAASTRLVTTHELGHTLGLGHDDPPQSVMRPRTGLATRDRPNATERSYPWIDETLGVAVRVGPAVDRSTVDAQVDRALAYYERGPPGVPSDLRFVRDAADPEVVVIVRSGVCPVEPSCVRRSGPDPDRDGAIETYDRFEIRIDEVRGRAVGWHVGYWLADALGMERDADKPAPFRNATAAERRSEWWRQ